MVLNTETIEVLYMRNGLGRFHLSAAPLQCEYDHCIHDFARAIEAEVRKQDDALILQLVEALNECQGSTQERIDALTESGMDKHKPIYFRSYVQDLQRATDAITAARARLDGRP